LIQSSGHNKEIPVDLVMPTSQTYITTYLLPLFLLLDCNFASNLTTYSNTFAVYNLIMLDPLCLMNLQKNVVFAMCGRICELFSYQIES
jgi:hypothetical protein